MKRKQGSRLYGELDVLDIQQPQQHVLLLKVDPHEERKVSTIGGVKSCYRGMPTSSGPDPKKSF